MPARKKTSKKTSREKKPEKKSSRKKPGTSEIPVLTRRAITSTAAQHEHVTASKNSALDAQYVQEIRALVTAAVNESVPEIIERIMEKLIPPK